MKVVKGLIGVTLAVSVLTGCGVFDTAQGEGKTIVISDDVALQSTMEDAEVSLSKPEKVSLNEKITYQQLLGVANEELYFVKNNSLYQSDLAGINPVKIEDIEVKELSKNHKKALSVENGKIKLYNLDTNEVVDLGNYKENDGDVGFADQEGNYICYYSFSTNNYILIDTETKKEKSLDFKKLFNKKDFSFERPTIYKDSIYLSTHTGKDGTALYKVSFDQKKEMILGFPHKGDQIARYDFLNDDTIIFNGTYNEESGIYVYNIKDQEINKIVSGGTDSEGTWTPFYSLSPDGKKLLFDTVVREDDKFFNNVYLAMLEDGKLTRNIRILEKAELPAVIALLGSWSEDSSTFFIPRTNKLLGGYDEEKIDYISVYELDTMNP
ncbi:hypothetical protein ACFYKX_03110 [Cytobacillus sp. FJAT-54145]|uniref:Uncharacterized protein n=1 Tax=Cytobacillus spartinae TaxID=3299023 RepID=A0ABW6K7A1_9BACI